MICLIKFLFLLFLFDLFYNIKDLGKYGVLYLKKEIFCDDFCIYIIFIFEEF